MRAIERAISGVQWGPKQSQVELPSWAHRSSVNLNGSSQGVRVIQLRQTPVTPLMARVHWAGLTGCVGVPFLPHGSVCEDDDLPG